MSRNIEIIVTPDGKTSIQTHGFTGVSCREASKFLEEALGQRLQDISKELIGIIAHPLTTLEDVGDVHQDCQ